MTKPVLKLTSLAVIAVVASCMAPERKETAPSSDPGGVCNSGQAEIDGFNTDCINGNCCDKWADGSLTEDFKGCLDSYGCATNSGEGGATGEGGAANGGSGQGGANVGGGAGASGAGGSCQPSGSNPCDTYPQCGCPAGQGCYITGDTGATKCLASKGLSQGQRCTNVEDCAPGLICDALYCRKYCESSADCGAATCMQGILFDFCSDQCDPLQPAQTCGAGAGCGIYSEAGVSPGGSICLPAGASTTTCEYVESCAPGYVCIGGYCYHWCRPGKSDCPTGTCTGFSGGYAYAGSQAFGVCK